MFDWTGEETVAETVRCRTFRPSFDGGLGTAVLLDREGTLSDSTVPVVLIQHGGSSSKSGPDVWDVVPELVGRQGLRLLALDGPVHGARARAMALDPNDGASIRSRFFDLWISHPEHVDVHVQRWQTLIDDLQQVMPTTRLMWMGHSMGAAYGIPLLSVDKRIERAVTGMWGTSFANSARLVTDAATIACPVLFQQKWNDEIFSRDGQFEVFDAIGTTHKRLHIYPGKHTRVGLEQLNDISQFLVADLDHFGGVIPPKT